MAKDYKIVDGVYKGPEHYPGSLDLGDSSVTDLGSLKSVGGYLDLRSTAISDLGSLESVGGSLFLNGTAVTDLGSLESVGGYLDLRGTAISDLGSCLKRVEGGLFIDSDDFESLGSLSEVTGNMAVRSKCEIDWGVLSYVGGYLDLYGSNNTRVIKNDIKLGGSLCISGSGVCTVLNLDWEDNIKVLPYSLRRTTLGKLKKEERVLRGLPVHTLVEMANAPLQKMETFRRNVILDELYGRQR